MAPPQHDAWGAYLDAQRRRAVRMAAATLEVVDTPAVFGWAARAGAGPAGRLFVLDDGALPGLGPLLGRLSPLGVTVLPGAPGVLAALAARTDLRPEAPTTAMVLADLGALPEPPPALAAGLTVRPVRRVAADDPHGVALETAAAACARADPGVREQFDPAGFVAHLRRAPQAVVLAAVDAAGEVRATAGASLNGTDATVFFVSTDLDWRQRGIGTAMTARALLAVRAAGATRAALDASGAGERIYTRLGFATAGELRTFHAR